MPVIWQISAIHLDKKTLISGVILKYSPFVYDKRTGRIRNFLKVIKSYFIPVIAGKEISILIDENRFKTTTDKYGGFSLVVDFLVEDVPLINLNGQETRLKILQRYPVIFNNSDGDFDVISDIDDTIVVSKTAEFLKRINILAFVAPRKRKAIPYTFRLFELFKKQHARVIYVSKSESNLFAMISTFIELHNLPKGSLVLTSYLKLIQLLNPQKGHDYKLNTIRFIIKNSAGKSFVLLGDDSQKDMEVYTTIAEEFPERILKVYIRQTGHRIRKGQKEMWEKLKLTGVDVKYFDNEDKVDENSRF